MYIQVLCVDSLTIHMAASDQDLEEINKEYINSISTGELKLYGVLTEHKSMSLLLEK